MLQFIPRILDGLFINFSPLNPFPNLLFFRIKMNLRQMNKGNLSLSDKWKTKGEEFDEQLK